MKTFNVVFKSGNADMIQADHYELNGPWVTFIQRQQGVVAARYARRSLIRVDLSPRSVDNTLTVEAGR